MLCPNCETQNDDNARLCVECGFPLAGTVSRGAGAISPARTATPQQRRQQSVGSQDPSSSYVQYESLTKTVAPSDTLTHDRPLYKGSAPDFSWDAPVDEGNPAKGLFEPTDSFHSVPKSVTPAQTHPYDGARRAQQPQIVQVDLQGRVIASGNTQQMPPIESAQPTSYSDEAYDFFETEYVDEHEGGRDQEYEASYSREDTIPVGDEGQDAFDAFYQNESARKAKTLKFDENEGTTVQPSQSYLAPHARTGEKQERRTGAARNYRIPQKKQGLNGKQRVLVVGGIVLVVAALVLVVGFAFGIWGGVPVPNVENMNQAEAVKVLEENGFTTKIVEVKSDEIEGRVLSTEPHAGAFAEEGSEIIVNVAVARTIPDVVGESLDTALEMLEESGYTNVKTQVERTSGPENIVLSSTPTADTRAKSTMEITLTVSENYRVPDIANMSYEEAESAIKNAGLVPTVVYIDTEDYPDGTIIGSDPGAGAKVDEGSTVAISIARKRGVELNALASSYLAAGNNVTINGVNYQVESITSLNYQGNDVVAFTIQALPYVEFFGETLYASASQTVTGSIQYNSDNDIVSVS